MLGIKEVKDCVFYDKNGKEIARFQGVSNISLYQTIPLGGQEPILIDCGFSALKAGLTGTYNGKEIKNSDESERYKEVYGNCCL